MPTIDWTQAPQREVMAEFEERLTQNSFSSFSDSDELVAAATRVFWASAYLNPNLRSAKTEEQLLTGNLNLESFMAEAYAVPGNRKSPMGGEIRVGSDGLFRWPGIEGYDSSVIATFADADAARAAGYKPASSMTIRQINLPLSLLILGRGALMWMLFILFGLPAFAASVTLLPLIALTVVLIERGAYNPCVKLNQQALRVLQDLPRIREDRWNRWNIWANVAPLLELSALGKASNLPRKSWQFWAMMLGLLDVSAYGLATNLPRYTSAGRGLSIVAALLLLTAAVWHGLKIDFRSYHQGLLWVERWWNYATDRTEKSAWPINLSDRNDPRWPWFVHLPTDQLQIVEEAETIAQAYRESPIVKYKLLKLKPPKKGKGKGRGKGKGKFKGKKKSRP